MYQGKIYIIESSPIGGFGSIYYGLDKMIPMILGEKFRKLKSQEKKKINDAKYDLDNLMHDIKIRHFHRLIQFIYSKIYLKYFKIIIKNSLYLKKVCTYALPA